MVIGDSQPGDQGASFKLPSDLQCLFYPNGIPKLNVVDLTGTLHFIIQILKISWCAACRQKHVQTYISR